MLAKEAADLLVRAGEGIGQREVMFKCECNNLETVFVRLEENGKVRVSDGYDTFRYLSQGNDSTYVPVDKLDIRAARRACEAFQVAVKDDVPEQYPSIECDVAASQSIEKAVERVAQAIDAVFALARRADLK